MEQKVLMIRTGEMMRETNHSGLEKTDVAQKCCTGNMDRPS